MHGHAITFMLHGQKTVLHNKPILRQDNCHKHVLNVQVHSRTRMGMEICMTATVVTSACAAMSLHFSAYAVEHSYRDST
jgi:hypothetical protein